MIKKKEEASNSNSNVMSFPRILITAKNDEQKALLKTIGENTITFVTGSPGTGKTFLSLAYGLQLLAKEKVKKIVLTRPVIEAAGERLGFLPGDMTEKINPYLMPVYEILSELMPPENVNKLISKTGREGPIRVIPLAFMRGMAQPLTSKVITPSGYRNIGDLKINDIVLSADGSQTRIIGVYPQGIKSVYKVTFSDGTSAECCNEHLWNTRTLSEKRHNKEFTTKPLWKINNSIKTKRGQKNHEIPIVINSLDFSEQEVSVDPYLLGLLLGDGHLGKSVNFCTSDIELIDNIRNILPNDMICKYVSRYDYKLINQNKENKNYLMRQLKELNLIGTLSHTKFIPDIYKFNTKEIRLAVLRGLMDTDGSVFLHRSGKSRSQYYTTSKKLAEDVIFLVNSLGGIAHSRLRILNKDFKYINGHRMSSKYDLYVIDITMEDNPFKLSRKAKLHNPCRPKRLISSIEKVSETECVCIQVDHPSQLYLTDNFIVTHNTFHDTYVLCEESQNSSPEQIRMLLTRLGENSKIVLCGDLKQSDIKQMSGLEDSSNLLKDIEGIGRIHLSIDAIVRHPLVQSIEKKYEERADKLKAKKKNIANMDIV